MPETVIGVKEVRVTCVSHVGAEKAASLVFKEGIQMLWHLNSSQKVEEKWRDGPKALTKSVVRPLG